MIQPTVGRIVLFCPMPGMGYDEVVTQGNCPVPAIITHVWGDRMVNLAVFDADGRHHAITSVTLRQPEDEADNNTHCEWMPYQVKKPTGSESGEKAAGEQAI